MYVCNVFNAWCGVQDKGVGKGSLGCKLWSLDKHIEFDHQHAWEKSAPLAAPAIKPKDVKYNAKVKRQQGHLHMPCAVGWCVNGCANYTARYVFVSWYLSMCLILD